MTVKWHEARGGKNYVVVAEIGENGWRFIERLERGESSYAIPATKEFVARAEAILSLEVDELAAFPIADPVELGDYRDNEAALQIAILKVRRGRIAEATATLEALEHHILRANEEQSARWLLPRVRQQLQTLRVMQESTQTPRAIGVPERHRASILKAQIVDAAVLAGIVTFCHAMLVHEFLRLPGINHNVLSANIAAGVALGLAYVLLTRKTSPAEQ